MEISVLVNGVRMPITPDRIIDGKAHYTFPPGNIITFTYQCQGQGIGTWWADIAVYNYPDSGGHSHSSPYPPYLQFILQGDTVWHNSNSIYSPAMQMNKAFAFDMQMPEYATHLSFQATWRGACRGSISDTDDVQVAGLMPLSSNSKYYTLLGATKEHPYNHYGTPQMNTALADMAKNWKDTCKKADKIYINDMSLVWGGLFDIHNDWQIEHRTHRFGINADMEKKTIKKADREKFVRFACKTFYVRSEGDATNEGAHYHLELRNNNKDYDISADTDEKGLACCVESATEPIDMKCIDLYRNGSLVPETDTESDCK